MSKNTDIYTYIIEGEIDTIKEYLNKGYIVVNNDIMASIESYQYHILELLLNHNSYKCNNKDNILHSLLYSEDSLNYQSIEIFLNCKNNNAIHFSYDNSRWYLLYAVRQWDCFFEKLILDKRIKTNDNHQWLFSNICEEGYIEAFNYMINKNIVDLSIIGGKALVSACCSRKDTKYISETLIKNNVDLLYNWEGGSALFNAWRNSKFDIVSMFLQKKEILNNLNDEWINNFIAKKESRNYEKRIKQFQLLKNINNF